MADAKEPKKKPKKTSAQKRNEQSIKRNARNRMFKSQVRTAVRSLKDSLEKKEEEGIIKEKMSSIYSLMDKGAKKGIFTSNKAARIKSRLALKGIPS